MEIQQPASFPSHFAHIHTLTVNTVISNPPHFQANVLCGTSTSRIQQCACQLHCFVNWWGYVFPFILFQYSHLCWQLFLHLYTAIESNEPVSIITSPTEKAFYANWYFNLNKQSLSMATLNPVHLSLTAVPIHQGTQWLRLLTNSHRLCPANNSLKRKGNLDAFRVFFTSLAGKVFRFLKKRSFLCHHVGPHLMANLFCTTAKHKLRTWVF